MRRFHKGNSYLKKDPKVEILKKAHSLFGVLDINKTGQIKMSDIEKHFGSYSQASAKIMLREIDLDKDTIITYK
jgi:Ca2+-binding EF-hand superfamily protein